MELTGLICEMSLCRLCGEENVNGTELFPTRENEPDLSQLVNRYLPLKIENDRKFPTKICPGCNIQLEATKSFMDLIVQGQIKLRQLYKLQQDKLYRQEKQRLQLEEALKSVNPSSSVDTYTIQSDETGEKFLIQIFSQGPLFPPEHELSLKAEGLTRPRRKRGRPPKPPQPPNTEDQLLKANEKDNTKVDEKIDQFEETTEDGKRKRRIKVPTRYSEAIQGKELDKVFKQEGVIDEESVSDEDGTILEEGENSNKVEEVIGRLETENGEDLGQPVIINKTLNKTRPRNKSIAGQSKRRRKYQCDICGREFLHHGRYELHKKMHDVEYNCTQDGCSFTTDKKSLLEQHQQESVHSGHTVSEKVDKYGTIQLPTDLKPSQASKLEQPPPPAPKKEFTCENCHKSFSCKQNYEVHFKAVHAGERPFACELCNKRFSYANSLKVHLLQHFPKTGPDDDSSAQYKCPSCPKSFRHPSSLQYHRDSEHTNGRRFVCNKCDKPFKHRQLLQRHQLVHSDERPHRCSQCNSAFKTRANLIHHTRTVHSGQRSHWCSQCDKAFAHKTALKLHQRWHSGVRPYQCEFCKKSFSQKGNLAEHRRIHTGEKPYQCDHCGRAFTTSSQFRLHKKRHLDERPHRCEYCQKSFLHKVTLRCHMRRHFDERPFKCQQCPKTFPEAWALKKHERLHTGEKPYKCDLCSKAFADSSNLAKHRRTHRNLKDKQMLFVTYEKDGGDAIVTYIEPQDTVVETNEIINVAEEIDGVKTIQLQQLVDQEGNPISFITQDGQQVKVVTSNEDGQENIQGLLPDGTLVPISLTTVPEKNKPILTQIEDTQKTIDVPIEGQLLSSSIQFLSDDDPKVDNNIQFVAEDNQNMCLVTTYNIEDSINPQYLSMP
ncbi:zinc finger protein 271-like isoform X2 [Tribolium madens]|uniref:zinc finger protein 271-like isoform X2 n=1 Tax=Tribolium madens TaxID=41895 RepID=UPI001CF71E8A|nr:zinc finger protein 271-like isoform X2 [Tribolium madens]